MADYDDESIKDLLSMVAAMPTHPEAIQRARAALLDKYSRDPRILTDVFEKSMKETLSAQVGILCLCERNNSILMWSHYACRHTGFVLGFDRNDVFFAHRSHEPQEIGELRKITYVNTRPMVKPPFTDPVPDILFAKNHEWEYESEWRILRFLADATKVETGRVDTGSLHLFAIPPSAFRHVILGRVCAAETIQALLQAKTDSEMSHLEFYQAQLSRHRFELDILPYVP